MTGRISVLLLFLAGCADSAGPEPFDLRTQPASLAVVGGGGQSDTISATLSGPIRVELVTEEETPRPIPGVIVNFVVVEQGCGRAFAGSAVTDSLGRAADRWELGTKAGTCTLEVRAVDSDGTPRVFASTTSTVLPGAPDSLDLSSFPLMQLTGSPVMLPSNVPAWDRAGNPTTATPAKTEYTSSTEKSEAVTITAAGFTTTRSVTWLSDLRRKAWTLRAKCRYTGARIYDSLAITLQSDSVVYEQPLTGEATLWGTAEIMAWPLASPMEQRTETDYDVSFRQDVGRIVWPVGSVSTLSGSGYRGGYCPSGGELTTTRID